MGFKRLTNHRFRSLLPLLTLSGSVGFDVSRAYIQHHATSDTITEDVLAVS